VHAQKNNDFPALRVRFDRTSRSADNCMYVNPVEG
jgi:hypothetical protein